MTAGRPDVIEILNNELKYHRQQIERIKKALEVLNTEESVSSSNPMPRSRSKKIPWTAKVMEVMNDHPEKAFDTNEICDELANRGIPEDVINENRQSIYSVLTRGVTQRRVMKVDHGKYKKFKREPVRYEKEKEEPPYGMSSSL